MKNRITFSTIVILLFCSFTSLSQTIKWEDRMNGDNSVAGLQARGWIVLNEDGGGFSDPWFQGDIGYFNSYEGPDSGYVASDFDGANSNDILDQWLISPAISVVPGDSLSFVARSPDLSLFDDSIHILISSTGGTTPSAFSSLGRFLVSKSGWQGFYILFNITSTVRFAIRYYLSDITTTGEYIGLDLFQLYTKSSTYPTDISINKSFGFTNVSSSNSYRMIGLPGQTNFPIPTTGTRGADWNAFYDNGAATNYLIEYDGTNNFNFNPGNGFWLLSKDAININAQVTSVALAGDNTYAIPLHSGWNIISNPFERSTNWAAVQNANGLAGNAIIYDWIGTWADPSPTIFSPYKAYYFNNITVLNSLKIPYDPGGTLAKSSEESKLIFSFTNDIKLSLLSNGEEKSKVFIGFNSQSVDDFDSEDYFAPPGDFEDARVVIRNNNLSTDYKVLMKESRKEIGEGQIYNLEIKNLTEQDLVFKIENLAAYQNYLVYLVDERLNNSLKLSSGVEIKLAAAVKSNNYRLLIGTQEFIDANKGKTIPNSYALYQNYPNPFNPRTTIRYSIPRESRVSIKLFDPIGNEITTLLDEEKSPGNYEVEVDTKDLASGVYIYKLQAGAFAESKKMILLR